MSFCRTLWPIFYFQVKPQILKSNGASAAVQQSIPSGPADPNLAPITTGVVTKEEDSSKYAALSSYLGSPTHSSDPGSPPPMLNLKTASTPANDYPFLTLRTKSTDECISSTNVNTSSNEDGVALFMESILQHRKNLRLSHRTFKVPFMKEKKKRVMDFKPLEELRYVPVLFSIGKDGCFCKQFLNNSAAVCFSDKIQTWKIPKINEIGVADPPLYGIFRNPLSEFCQK